MNFDKEKAKKVTLIKLAEYAFLLPALGIFALGLYYTYGEEIVADTAHKEAIEVVDSVETSNEGYYEKQEKQIKILHNYMMLQNKKLYDKAKSLEEN